MEFILAIGALAAIAWAGVIFLRGGLVGGCLLVLLAGSCFGHPFFHVPAGPIPITLDRLLLVALVGQYCLYWRWGWLEHRPLLKADYLMAALLFVLAASTVTHDFKTHGAQPLAFFILFFCMPATIYWVARSATFTEHSARWMFGSLAVFGIYLALTAVAETHQATALVFPRYITSPAYSEFFGRGRGPFLNPVSNGIVQALGLGAALCWWPRVSRRGKLMLMALIPLFAYGTYSTLTRTAWMGAGCVLLVMVALTTPRAWRAPVLVCAMLASMIGVAATWENLLVFKRDKELSAADMAESARLRPILATVAWHMFLDRPLLGCGFGQYSTEMLPYLSDRTTDLPLEKARPYVQHNAFLALLTETGLIGMGLFVALLLAWSLEAWRLWRSAEPLFARQMGLLFLAFLGAYLPNAMFHDVSLVAMVNMTLFFLGGTVVGLSSSAAARSAAQTHEKPRATYGLAGA